MSYLSQSVSSGANCASGGEEFFAVAKALHERSYLTENGDVCVGDQGSKIEEKVLEVFSKITRESEMSIGKILDTEGHEELKQDLLLLLLFHVRGIKDGAGERDASRKVILQLAEQESYHPFLIDLIPKMVDPKFGYWKDLLKLITAIDGSAKRELMLPVREALFKFMIDSSNEALELISVYNRSLSIDPSTKKPAVNIAVGKWLPRDQSEFGKIARELAKRMYPEVAFGSRMKKYRKMLAVHVSFYETVETMMCSGRWDEIDFTGVPSVSGARYRKAFENVTKKGAKRSTSWIREECARIYSKFLEEVKAGTKKINAKSSQVTDFAKDFKESRVTDHTRELQFKAYLDNLVKEAQENVSKLPQNSKKFNMEAVIACIDVSGSMDCKSGASGCTCMDLAVLLGMIVSQLSSGHWKDKFFNFDTNPMLHDLSDCSTFREKFQKVYQSPWGGSTDFRKMLDQILQIAIAGKLCQDQLPKYLFVFSDMQFNSADGHYSSSHESMVAKFKANGYELPMIIYWNLNDKPGFPVDAHTPNTFLVSGFSPALMKSFFTGGDMEKMISESEVTPLKMMLSTLLESEGLAPIREVIELTRLRLAI